MTIAFQLLLQNLLQSETEGINDEKIGFYGRCMLHTIEPRCLFIYDPLDEIGSQEQKEFTCARVEVFSSFIVFLGLIWGEVGSIWVLFLFLFYVWRVMKLNVLFWIIVGLQGP